MCEHERSRKSALWRMSTVVILVVSGLSVGSASATEPRLYEGMASLCAIDPATEETVTKGNGVIIERHAVQLYRIETNSDLINGWEVLTSQFKTARNNKQYYMGTAALTPHGYEDTGTLKENLNILQDGSFPAGTYTGTGKLKGVTADCRNQWLSCSVEPMIWLIISRYIKNSCSIFVYDQL